MTSIVEIKSLVRWLSLPCLLLIAGVASAEADRSASQWIEWASVARDEHSYVGEFIYQHGDDIETMRIWRVADPKQGARERLHSLSGEPREILRGGDSVTCILPNSDSMLIDERQFRRSISARIPADADRLAPHYGLQIVGEDRVAGRAAMHIALTPQDSLRYGYAIWIDQQTGLLLRAEVMTPSGEMIERLMMLDLDLRDDIDAAELQPVLPDEGFVRVTAETAGSAANQQAAPDWQVINPPAGYQLAIDKVQQLPGRPHAVRHMVYSDGLATVSVYVEPAVQADAIEGPLQMGAMNAYGRALDGHQAIVVGEVPAAAVEQIAQSLARQSAR